MVETSSVCLLLRILWMMDDGDSQLPVLEFLRAEEKRGLLWNLTDPPD